MSINGNLTPQQQAAVAVDDGAYLLTAPPGSGKTEVLVRRIERLLRESRGATFRVLALTFTTRAAENISRRIEADIADEAWRLTAGTFHHFCLEVIRSYGEVVGVYPDVTVFAEPVDRAELLIRGLDEDGYAPSLLGLDDSAIRRVLAEIDLMQTRLIPPDAAPRTVVEGTDVPADAAYLAYSRVLEQVGGIDFAGMLAKAQQLLADSEWTASHYRGMYRFILIDEGQDLNLAQYEVLKALCGTEHRNVFMAADENQSIFGFNGASPKYVDRFQADFEAKTLPLTSNFRCGSAIVAAGNRLAANFVSHGFAARTESGCEAAGVVDMRALHSEADEGRDVADWVDRLLVEGLPAASLAPGESPDVVPEDIAVLGRTRYALEGTAEALRERNREYVFRTGDARLFDSSGWRTAYLALRLLANPRDFPVRQRLWLAMRRGDQAAADPPESIEELLGDIESLANSDLGGLAAPLIARAHGRIDDAALVVSLINATPPAYADEHDVMAWVDDQEEFTRSWRRHIGTGQTTSATLSGFLGALFRLQRVAVDEAGVRLLTIHAAKGLEFRAVAIVGMNQGTFPHYRSLSSAHDLDEERRNAYVAVTRASRVLLLTRPAVRTTRYGPRLQDRSQFLDEMALSERAA